MLRVEFGRRRCFIVGRRVHHGALGCLSLIVGLRLPNPYGPLVFGLGVGAIVDDWHDRPWIPRCERTP